NPLPHRRRCKRARLMIRLLRFMRIDHLKIENFKKFRHESLDLHRQFTLLVGDNGSGKTSILDALAVALGLWHKAAPGSGWRNINTEEIRLEPRSAGDRIMFEPRLPSKISVVGAVGGREGLKWVRMIRKGGTRTTNAEAKDAEQAISELAKAAEAQAASLPVLAYYGAGRAWLATNKRHAGPVSQRKRQRLDAYYNCLDTRIRDRDLNEWFLYEAAANGQSEGRLGYRAVKQAVLDCIPGADGLRFDSDLKDIVLSIRGFEQPFYNLSAGQRMMLAMVADIAIKALTLNSYQLGSGLPGGGDPMLFLKQTPGIVLIDELDVHLHPNWQRRAATDLKRTFAGIQFVCTSHSPQVIGEVSPEEIRLLEDETVSRPSRSHGIDSSRILEELMGAASRNEVVADLLKNLSRSIDREDFSQAQDLLGQVEKELGPDDPEVTRARTLMAFLESEV
ncbi:MAG TPA: AAA family ATPase, partial [Humisphaera sp.]|nr:AAA family ATPase [Humisphaera sp.]